MRTYQFKIILALMVGILYLHVRAEDNLLYNNGFEDKGYIYDWRSYGCAAKQISEPKHVNSGKYSALFEIASGKYNAYIENKRPYVRVVPGETYELTVMAKGKGNIKLSCYRLGRTPMHVKGLGSVCSQSYELNSKWQHFTFKHIFKEKDILEFNYRIILEGKGAKVYLDDAQLKRVMKQEAKFVISNTSIMACPGENISMKVAVMYGGKNSKSKLLISDADVTELKSLSLADKFNNNWEISFQIPDNSVGKTFKLNLFDQTSGAGQNIFVEVFSRKQYSAIKNASSELSKPKKEWNALILGDSLSDLFRGQNYTDWLRYWMPEISWHNYGVRGDYITRIVDRLKGKRVWGFRRYKNVFAHVPDVVIIFCGHNDSRLTKSSGFKKTKVSIVNFKKDLLFLVRFLKAKKTKMKIILLAPAASNFYKSEKSWNAKGKSSDLFGSPDVLRQFRDAVKEAADEENCGFIDIYKFTKEYADNQKLFQPDGVHLSETGNYFVALKIIQYFASYGYWENIDRNSRKIKKQKDNFKN